MREPIVHDLDVSSQLVQAYAINEKTIGAAIADQNKVAGTTPDPNFNQYAYYQAHRDDYRDVDY